MATPPDGLSLSMVYLGENNIVLDDDQRTDYYCRYAGAKTTSGGVPGAYWFRGVRRVCLDRDDPVDSNSGYGGRSVAMVF